MLAGRLPEAVKTTFLTFLSQTLLVESSNIAHQVKDFPHGVDHSHLNALFTGYLTLGKAGLLKPALKVCSRHVANCRYVTLWRGGGFFLLNSGHALHVSYLLPYSCTYQVCYCH